MSVHSAHSTPYVVDLYLDSVRVVALLNGGHRNTDHALGAGEGRVDREGVCLLDLVRGGLLLQDLSREDGREEGEEVKK